MSKATMGRLDHSDEINHSGQCNEASDASHDSDIWVKIDLGEPSSVTGIITQGAPYYPYWVTSLSISYSLDDVSWIFVMECGYRKVFDANFDMDSQVTVVLPRPINAQYIRMHPVTFNIIPSMRFELLGVKHTIE
ncbi:lactadherin-like [Lytechinus variegatus]|uniref:lactadherin-like n=1 Tax=Lytechinus variegatus TaxID=7654 RepID=UPI001BB1FD4C|nr:lactadherin-like [Lytechinus variegatus]